MLRYIHVTLCSWTNFTMKLFKLLEKSLAYEFDATHDVYSYEAVTVSWIGLRNMRVERKSIHEKSIYHGPHAIKEFA